MLNESLDKLKRSSIMSAILMMTLGAVIMICPEAYIASLTLMFGYALIVVALVMMLNFLSSRKSLMDYFKFSGALALGLAGLCGLVFRTDIMRLLAWMAGFLLVVDGIRSAFNSLTFCRRSQRKGWWFLTILSAMMIAAGVIVFINPWWDTPNKLMKVIGCAVFFSSIVSGIRLIWSWPLRGNAEGGTENGEA